MIIVRFYPFFELPFITGTTLAWQMPSLLLQLMFAIGSDGTIVPNTKKWYQDLNFVVKDTEGRRIPGIVYNVNKVIVYALASALEVYFWTKRDAMSECNLDTFAHLIDNSRRHSFHLKIVCANILSLDIKKGRRGLDLNVSQRDAVDPRSMVLSMKHHLFGHFPWLVRMFGDLDCVDTNLGENFHKFVGKDAFESSNKQYGAELLQMCNYVVKVEGTIVWLE